MLDGAEAKRPPTIKTETLVTLVFYGDYFAGSSFSAAQLKLQKLQRFF